MVKVQSNLILPEKYAQQHLQPRVNTFKEQLEDQINKNQHRDEPYFLSYHENDDQILIGVTRGKWQVHKTPPIRWARQIVFWVDNKKGFKEWLWTVDDDRKTAFNVEGIQKAIKEGAIVPKK